MTDLSCGPDPVVERILSETGNVKETINRLTSQLHWTVEEACSEIRLCIKSRIPVNVKKIGAKRRSVPRTG